MQLSHLMRAHRRVLIAKRLHAHATEVFDPGEGASYRRLTKADDLLDLAQERFRLLIMQARQDRK